MLAFIKSAKMYAMDNLSDALKKQDALTEDLPFSRQVANRTG